MTYNILANIQYCQEFVGSIATLIYYSHGVPVVVSLFLSFFVYFHNRKSLLGKILILFSIVFSIWAYLNLSIWFGYSRGDIVMYSWAPIEIFSVLLFFFAFYFVYVFIEEKDVALPWKLFFFSLMVPVIIFSVTDYNMEAYDIQECVAIEGSMYISFVNILKISLVTLTVLFSLYKLITNKIKRTQIGLLVLGIAFFLYSRLIAGYISEQTLDFRYELYGLYGMVIFIGILTYLIVKYQVLNIKLASAQALIFTITILIASQFFFVRNSVNVVLTGVTLTLVVGFGWWLVRSVKQEIKQREEMEQLARELAEANKRRERINKELEQANRKLKKLDEAKSEFISIASHQLRTPLTAIKGYGSMLLDGDFGELKEQRQRDAIEKMFISNNRLIALVENLLNVSRIESRRLRFDFKKQQLEALVSESVAILQKTAENAGLYLKLEKPASSARNNRADKPLPAVYMDDEKIRQVALNFIDNAIKYTRTGGITVSLFAENSSVVCKVADTGIGVSETDKSRLFQKFTRGKDAFLVNTEGTGLGLYVAQMMVNSHRGKIWVESDGAGKGSKFCFSLPVASSPAARQLKAEAAKEKAAEQKPAGAQPGKPKAGAGAPVARS